MPNEEFVDYSLELEGNDVPIAVVLPAEQEVVVGAIVRLDGRSSIDPNGTGLTYTWSFVQVPIGSQVETFGFSNFEEDASIVGFAPDITGTYKVQLVVNDGSLDSDPAQALVDVRVILVPNHQGYVPDASFIWNYLSDFWTQVADRKRFETFWSAAIQITASEMLKLYQYQYNKSIRDIQETIQKRWLSFSPGLELDRTSVSFILADDDAGSSASTFIINSESGLPEASQPSYSNVITVPLTEGDFSGVALGRLLQLENRSYTLARTNEVFQAINYGTDGATSGTVTFTGSQFTPAMVGATLRLLAPDSSTLLGDYVIATYVGTTEVTVQAIHPGTTWPGSTNLTYVVLPATAQSSSFFADQMQVPAGLDAQHWRLSATLISSELDFEAQGVSPGDLIEVEVTRIDLRVLSTFYIQVVSVDRGRVGFVMNLEDLVQGTPADGITEDIQVTLAADLIVPGLSSNPDGSLSYSLQAEEIHNTVTSTAFKRTYYEQELTVDDEINVGPFSITVRPVRIIRNRKMAIADDFVSVPILQEYVKQPDIIEDGDQIYLAMNGIRTAVSRRPYLLAENLDYIIDDESMITGAAVVVAGSDEITIPRGDLIDRSVQEGDTLEVTLGNVSQTFDIRRVLTADTVRVYPTPTTSSTAALFTLTRRVSGKFLRFIDGTFTKTSPAPTRLWSEISYLDNSEAIENNFGVLVGVRREDLERVGSGLPYKSAVAGLMYALSNGPTISNLTLAAQILIGLPFAQNAGVIKEINPGFRKRDDGSPLYGRILIEGRDRFNNSTGVTNIYFYPEGRQIFDTATSTWVPAVPELSGLAINPESGVEYTIGDAVTQFAPLSKGVEVKEYLTDPNWVDLLVAQGNTASILQKYHAFQVVVNSDFVTSVDVDLTAQFMRKVKAHYVRLVSALLKSLEDTVDIEDVLTFGRSQQFYDGSDLGTPTAPMFDSLDDNEAFMTIDGNMYTRLHVGNDLQTTYGTAIVSSVDAGFLTARIAQIESWVAPKVRPGDLLSILGGVNAGQYTIDVVNSDSQLVLTGAGTSNFQTLSDQRFFIHRPLKNPIFAGQVVVTNGTDLVTVQESGGAVGSLDTTGVSVGDTLVFGDVTTLNSTISKRYTISEVIPNNVTAQVRVSVDISEPSGTYVAWIIREGIMTNDYVQPYGQPQIFRLDVTATQHYINFVDDAGEINSLNIALLRPGSQITIEGIPYTVLKFEPSSRRALVTPPLLTTDPAYLSALVELRPDMAATPFSVDFLDRMPGDMLELEIQASLSTGDDANTTSGSADVTLSVETPLTIGALPGDYFILLEGADSLVDVGSGPGVFPIHQIVGGTTVRLADQLTATGTFRYGLRRKVPNEG